MSKHNETHKIEIICSGGAAEDLAPLLEAFKQMGQMGSTRGFQIEDYGLFSFDGDGSSQISSIKVFRREPVPSGSGFPYQG